MKAKGNIFSSFKFCWLRENEERPDTEVVQSVARVSLMEHTNSLNGIDVSAKCLHRPLLTYLMNHFQQTTPTNNNDLSFLNIKRSKYSPGTGVCTTGTHLLLLASSSGSKIWRRTKINLEMNETSPVCPLCSIIIV